MSAAVLEDPWQARMERMRRLLPLPLLIVSTAGALVAPSAAGGWTTVDTVLVVAAAVWWAVVTARLRPDTSPGWRVVAFAVYAALAALLVGTDTWFGVFAYSGFLFAHGLGPRWRIPAFATTALVVSAAMVGGYPTAVGDGLLTYLLVAGVLLTLVINSANITYRALEQNIDRGRMIGELAEANRRLEESMAENAALHARLIEQARAAGVVDERRRLAGEIHDTLAQGLTAIVAQLEAAEQARHRPEAWSRHLTQARSLARSSLTEARRSVRALRPEQLANATLTGALGELTCGWSQQSGIAAELETAGTAIRAPADTEAALFRVAQEALTNVARHARAAKVRITLTYLDDTLLLDVADDGVGFDPAADTGGYGLVGMRHRLAGVSGTLTVESAPGYGTTLNAAVPLPGVDR
ncbi:MAG TPA: sensor histidine kinase [Actinomycetota bacterium]